MLHKVGVDCASVIQVEVVAIVKYLLSRLSLNRVVRSFIVPRSLCRLPREKV